MAELRKDPVIGRWVIVVKEKEMGPRDFKTEEHEWKEIRCPFCIGKEKLTPPEIYALRTEESQRDAPGWSLRVVPNKFPALQIKGDLNKLGIGLYDTMNGVGAHEVIIETPEHNKDLYHLPIDDIKKVIATYRTRSLDLRGDSRLKYILIFKNFGQSAGASLQHAHSQLIALPIIPKRVNELLKGAKRYYEYKERCVFCDIIRQEIEDKERVIDENEHFLAFAPFSSCAAFEMCIIPKEHRDSFDRIRDSEIESLAKILKGTLLRMSSLLNNPPYNFIVHTSPIEKFELPNYHWHIEIMPRLTRVAGYEWGTGFYIVFTSPEKAAKYLREVKINN